MCKHDRMAHEKTLKQCMRREFDIFGVLDLLCFLLLIYWLLEPLKS